MSVTLCIYNRLISPMVKSLSACIFASLILTSALGGEAEVKRPAKKPVAKEGEKKDEKNKETEEEKEKERKRLKALKVEAALLVKQLDVENAGKREAAEKRLVEIGGPASEALAAALGHESWSVREAAQKLLKKIGKPSVPVLKKASEKKDLEVATRARALLKDILGQGYLGIRLRWLQADERASVPDGAGAAASSVVKGGPGDKAGVEVGDIIHKVNGSVVKDVPGVIEVVKALVPDSKVKLVVYRGGKKKELEVLLGRRPSEEEINKATRSGR